MRINSFSAVLIAFAAVAIFASTGCDEPTTEPGNGGQHSEDSHAGHDHDGDDKHDDHPAHGPNGGHLIAIDSPEFQGEWCKFKDNDVIRMYILDAKEKPSPLKVESFIVTPMVGNEDVTFTLKAEDADENGASAVYSLDDKDLSIAIPLGVTIEITSGDKTLKGEIKAHKPLDH